MPETSSLESATRHWLTVALVAAACVVALPPATMAAPREFPRTLKLTEPLEAFDAKKPQQAVEPVAAGTEITVLALLPSRKHYRIRYADAAGKPVVVLGAADAVAPLLASAPPPQPPNPAAAVPPTCYTIRAGAHFCDQSNQQVGEVSELCFTVRFDESAKYRTQDPSNQGDINKLIGFADNGGHHHQNSARFGWCWNNDQLELHAYVYNNGVRASKLLGAVTLDAEHSCSLRVDGDTYVFTLDGKTDTMPRKSPGPRARGYKLFPYFGGDEVAPHAMRIWIREVWR